MRSYDLTPVCRPSSSLTGREGGGVGGGGAKLYGHENGWSAVNHSIPSGEMLRFSGGGDEMVQICRSFRYILPKKRQNINNCMLIISILKNYYCRVVCIILRTPEVLYVLYSQSASFFY